MLQWCYDKFAIRVQPTKEMCTCAYEAQCLPTSLEMGISTEECELLVGKQDYILQYTNTIYKIQQFVIAPQKNMFFPWPEKKLVLRFIFFIYQQARGKLVFCYFSFN